MTDLPDLAIRLRRAAFNRALAGADLARIGQMLAANVVMITGTDSAVLAGCKAQLTAWKREFSAPDRAIYVRTPETVLASPVEPIALEHGHWHSSGATSGCARASGVYTAKWRRTGADWLIEAEIFMTLAG